MCQTFRWHADERLFVRDAQIWPKHDWCEETKEVDKVHKGAQSPSSVTHFVQESHEHHSHCCNDIIRVHLNLPIGSQHTLIVDITTDTVSTLKQRISAVMHAHSSDLVVYHGRTPMTADIHKPLSFYQLSNNSTLSVFYKLDNMRTYMNKNYFTKVVKMHGTKITSWNVYPTVSGISDCITRKTNTKIDPFQPFTLKALFGAFLPLLTQFLTGVEVSPDDEATVKANVKLLGEKNKIIKDINKKRKKANLPDIPECNASSECITKGEGKGAKSSFSNRNFSMLDFSGNAATVSVSPATGVNFWG
eukprot:gene35831-44182_t